LIWPACPVNISPAENAVSNLGLMLAGQSERRRQR
jgi:hypothetical protein